ncbi:MAG: NAD(P)/FAD-dependent oxidoreductase [Ilumatobacteraceae bacterium]
MSFAVDRVVVVGASLAGLRAVETLRQQEYTGEIVVVSDEAEQPYDRPPLSKKVLSGEWEPDRIRLRKPEIIDSLGVEWTLGDGAVALDTQQRVVRLRSGHDVAFDGLVIATGGQVRRLPGQPDWTGIHELRTLSDSLSLRSELEPGRRVVVIGAGFIGLEVAATARTRGCDVTVLEGAPAPLIRGLGADMGRHIARIHEDNGVTVRCDVRVDAFVEGERGVVSGIRLADGEVIPADVVLVGVGVSPATGWLESSGLELRDGVVCDETLRAAPRIYAAGDVARWPNRLLGREMRVEHWTNASEQGAVAARNLLAESRGESRTAYESVPFFWSDQYTSRIQFIGRAEGDETVEIVAGSPDEHSFVALYHHGDELRAALGVSRPKQVMPFSKLLAERASWKQALEFVATWEQ